MTEEMLGPPAAEGVLGPPTAEEQTPYRVR
jgi:hypothetical protein